MLHSGHCGDCDGLGIKLEVDTDLIITGKSLISERCGCPWKRLVYDRYFIHNFYSLYDQLCSERFILLEILLGKLTRKAQRFVYGRFNEELFIFIVKCLLVA